MDAAIARPRVEAIVCVHNASRPVERAVASALRNAVDLRVTVVAHNVGIDDITRRLGALSGDSRVRVLGLADGVRSPANAFNFALDRLEAEFMSLIGSDDELADGALDAWARLAEESAADVVVAPILRQSGGAVPAPRVRRHRVRSLDGDRDRLFERVAPLGLVRMASFPGLRFTTGLPRGVDQIFGLHLWFSGASVAFDPTAPAYIEWDDQTDRVTTAGGALADDFGYLDLIEQDEVFARMTPAARRAVAARIVRVYLVGGVARRVTPAGLPERDRDFLASAWRRLQAWAPGVVGLLAVRDRRAISVALDASADGRKVAAATGGRGRYLSYGALMTVNPLRVLHRHAPLRSLYAGRRVAEDVAASRRA